VGALFTPDALLPLVSGVKSALLVVMALGLVALVLVCAFKAIEWLLGGCRGGAKHGLSMDGGMVGVVLLIVEVQLRTERQQRRCGGRLHC
jgi:hypothetical protein